MLRGYKTRIEAMKKNEEHSVNSPKRVEKRSRQAVAIDIGNSIAFPSDARQIKYTLKRTLSSFLPIRAKLDFVALSCNTVHVMQLNCFR